MNPFYNCVSGDAEAEALRQAILDEIYAGAVVGGFPAMLADEDAAHHN